MNGKIQETTEEISKILQRSQLNWEDILAYKAELLRQDIWQRTKGMWAEKKIDPLQYEKNIRQEMERIN